MKIRKLVSAMLALILIVTALPLSGAADAATEKTVFKGVDVSRWNGDIDWNTMKKKGVEFAIMRCYSYGTDKKFYEYYDGARKAGIDVGAYVFMYATTQKEAQNEANEVLKTLDGRALTYPLFVDIEYEELKKMKRDYLTDLVITELEIFKKAGYDVGTYCSKNFQKTYLNMDRLTPNYYIWTAKWSLYTTDSNPKKFYLNDIDPYDDSRPDGDLWQFSNGGDGPAYGTKERYLDLDFCYIDFKNKYRTVAEKIPESYPVPVRTLRYNSSSVMKGEDVAWVQAVLYQLGFTQLVDGVYSSATETAVKNFQKKYYLTQSGTADVETVNKLSQLYAHRDFTANIKYDLNNSADKIKKGSLAFGERLTLGEGIDAEKDGYFLSGWALYRSSDKRHLCTDGKWYNKTEISSLKKHKRVFRDGDVLFIDERLLSAEDIKADTFSFTAQWSTQQPPEYTVYNDGKVYSVYYSNKSYSQAQNFCSDNGGSLALPDTPEKLSALNVAKSGEKFYISPSQSVFSDGEIIASPSSANEVSGFIMESDCPHDSLSVKNFVDTLCKKNGYSGDKVCQNCGQTVEAGVTVKYTGHKYGAYETVKKATCKEAGLKEKICEVCSYKSQKQVAKTDTHSYKTEIVKKATLKSSGTEKQVCKICKAEKKYTISRIKSVTLSKKSAVYTGKNITPAVTVKDYAGKTLKKNTDYKVTYKKNKYVGTATVTVTFTGKYSGSIQKTFKIIPVATAFSSLKSQSKGRAELKWKKISKQSSGYKIEYCYSKSFSKDVKSFKVKNPATLTKTVKNLKSAKTVYFRIRTYKTVNGKNYYSDYSAVKSLKIK